jgi:hypothetical protein
MVYHYRSFESLIARSDESFCSGGIPESRQPMAAFPFHFQIGNQANQIKFCHRWQIDHAPVFKLIENEPGLLSDRLGFSGRYSWPLRLPPDNQ